MDFLWLDKWKGITGLNMKHQQPQLLASYPGRCFANYVDAI